MKPKPKILFIQDNNSPVVYYRMYCFAQKMSELGLAHCRMFPPWDQKCASGQIWEDSIKDYLPTIREMTEWADIVVCQYIGTMQGFSIVETTLKFKPCLMEMDDWFKGVPAYNGAFVSNRPGEQQDVWGTYQMQASTGIICATQYLSNLANQHNPRVYTIPNCIDFDLWDKHPRKDHDLIRIGWIGGASHGLDLKLIKVALYEILDKYGNVEVNIISCPPPDWPAHERLNLINNYSFIMDYPEYVKGASFDIGLAPLRDNYFNRAKSNLRYLEYSACKIPTVASWIEPFKTQFEGFNASTGEDWFKVLSELIENEDLRKSAGLVAYNSTKKNFNLEAISRKYVDVLTEAIG